MSSSIRTFGSNGPTPITIGEDDPPTSVSVCRDWWFDQDINGRWLICVMRAHDAGGVAEFGSLVVTDPRVSDFIATLGRLIADPDQFTDEPGFAFPH